MTLQEKILLDEGNGKIPRHLFFVTVSKRVLLGNWYNDALGGVHMVLLESEKKHKTIIEKPQN